MKRKSKVLNREERELLVLAALDSSGKYLSNSEIGQRLGVSLNRVKSLTHQACVKLGAHNRDGAIAFAMKRGEISLSDVYSLNELADICSSLSPDTLRRIAHLMRQGLEYEHLLEKYEQIFSATRKQDTILTKRERDVLILVGQGLTNQEIADRLYISISAVRIFLYRASAKLGSRRRNEAALLALKQREICIGDILPFNELIHGLAPLGADSIERIAQLMSQKLGQEHIPPAS